MILNLKNTHFIGFFNQKIVEFIACLVPEFIVFQNASCAHFENVPVICERDIGDLF